MPINWNEVDKARLKYIQNKETIKAEYKKECLACLNSLFRKPKKPKEEDFIYCYPCENWLIKVYDDVIGIRVDVLQESVICDEIKNLKVTHVYKTNVSTTYCINDNEENRKKVSEIVNIIEEYNKNINILRQKNEKMSKEFGYKIW